MINVYIYTLTVTTIVVLLLIAGLALTDRTYSRSKYILILLCISVSGLLVDDMPPELPPSRLYEVIGKFLSAPHIGLIWWFGLSLLDDKFRLGKIAWGGMVVSTLTLVFIFLGDVGLVPRPNSAFDYWLLLLQLVVALHVVWVCISGFRDDLVNARRNLRLWVAVLPAAVLFIVVASNSVLTRDGTDLLRLAFSLPVALLMLFWFTRFEPSRLEFAASPAVDLVTPDIQPQDRAAHTRLLAMMEVEKAYLEPDLTVNTLASRVGIPAHQLRTLVNRSMGFRNFSAFLAKYRIADIKAILADPERAREPILTIALNTGFSSLTTFNRTFRSEVGQSAGAYRKMVLGKEDQS